MVDYYDFFWFDFFYIIYFGKDEEMEVFVKLEELYVMFELYEFGSSVKLKQFFDEVVYKYKVGMSEFVFKFSYSIMEFVDFCILFSLFCLQMFFSIFLVICKLFKNEKFIQLFEFLVLFFGVIF